MRRSLPYKINKNIVVINVAINPTHSFDSNVQTIGNHQKNACGYLLSLVVSVLVSPVHNLPALWWSIVVHVVIIVASIPVVEGPIINSVGEHINHTFNRCRVGFSSKQMLVVEFFKYMTIVLISFSRSITLSSFSMSS